MKIKTGKVRFNVHSISAWMDHLPNLALGSGHPRISQERSSIEWPVTEGPPACLPLLLRVRVVAAVHEQVCHQCVFRGNVTTDSDRM